MGTRKRCRAISASRTRSPWSATKIAIPEGVSKVKPATPAHVPITIRTNKRKNIAQSNNNNNNIKEEEEEQHFFDEDCHVVPEYVPVELIDANDVEQVSELYSSVNTGVEFFPSAAATTASVYVPTAKSQKR